MPRIPGNSNAASSFLRSFRTSPSGPPPEKWPAPAVLRRWLRRPAFRAAFSSLQDTLRLQADFHLSTAATRAAAAQALCDPSIENQNSKIENLQLLRLSHLRQRFAAQSNIPADQDNESADETEDREITFLDVRHNLHLIPPEFRLTDDELRHVAWKAGYPMHLRHFPHFPPPAPQDSFYYYLIMDPEALIWYLHLYGQKTGDYRHSPITSSCKQLIPKDYDHLPPLPRFPADSHNNSPPVCPVPPGVPRAALTREC
jgi:hypothetical protein